MKAPHLKSQISKKSLPAGRQGFTLIETLVAVLILTTAIAGPLTIASKSLLTAQVAKDQVTAFYLAQDAVEYVRFKRDSACLAGAVSPCTAWLSTLSNCTGANGCYLDSTENSPVGDTPQACQSGGCIQSTFASSKFLYYDSTNNRFTYSTSGTTRTGFARQVSITTPVGGNAEEAKLTVQVSWSDTGSNTRSVTVYEDLFNWQ